MNNDNRRTLLFLVDDTQILLALKKRGFGAGKRNGVGGKLEPGESIEEAVIRECQEEIGVTPISFRPVAELDFYGGSAMEPWNMYVYAYFCDEWEGAPNESEEMAPQWYPISNIPYSGMWQDDAYWLPAVLDGKTITGRFYFDEHDDLKKVDMQEVRGL